MDEEEVAIGIPERLLRWRQAPRARLAPLEAEKDPVPVADFGHGLLRDLAQLRCQPVSRDSPQLLARDEASLRDPVP